MMGNLAPFVVNGPPTTNTNTVNFTGGPWTFIRTHVDSSAETLATWRLDEDTSAKVELLNRSSANNTFAPGMQFTGSATAPTTTFGGAIDTRIQSDSGSLAAHLFHVQTVAGAAIATRTLWTWRNNSNTVLDFLPLNSGANGALSWGTQSGAAPAFTTRSAGNRIILYSAISGTKVDNAIGVSASGADTWYTTQEGTSSYAHMWFGGTTNIMSLLGDGTFTVQPGGVTRFTVNTSGNALVTNGAYVGLDATNNVTFNTSAATDVNGATVSLKTGGTGRVNVAAAGDVGIGKTPTTGIILDVGGQLGLKSYTVATLPSASVQAGAIVYASDAGGNGPCIVVSNGTNWKRCDNTSTTVS